MQLRRPPATACRRTGLARAEWLLLLGLLVAALSVGLPWWQSRVIRSQQYQARNDILMILRACNAYFESQGAWPTMHDGAFGDYRYGEWMPNALVMNVLRAVDGKGNEDHSVNQTRRIYLDVPLKSVGASGLDGQGEFLDPWGMPYQIAIDTDHDKSTYVERSAYGPFPKRSVVVWSFGADRSPGTRHDIVSWKL